MQRPVAIEPISPFRTPAETLGLLQPETASTALVAAADIALVLDEAGVVLDVAHNGIEFAREGVAAWVGRPWIDTVTTDSRGKINELLATNAEEGIGSARQVNHVSVRGEDLPVSYLVVPLDCGGRRLAVGREMRSMAAMQHRLVEAQHASEREYTRLRDAEIRYRLLFQVSVDALLIVDGATGKVIEANPAAEALFGAPRQGLNGRLFPHGFALRETAEIEAMVARARTVGNAEMHHVHLANGTEASVSAALFRQESTAFLLVSLGLAGQAVGRAMKPDAQIAAAMIAATPEAYVVTDDAGQIRWINHAFLNLAQLATEEQASGESLDRFLGRPGVDMSVLLSTLRESGSVRMFATNLRGEFGSVVDVEICAARVHDGDQALYGFFLRNVENRSAQRREGALPRSVEQLTELVGRVPLKDLVRETTDVIERLCIEAALELTGDNRASAADMLGLSRQSLYVKLRRYGLGDLDAPEA